MRRLNARQERGMVFSSLVFISIFLPSVLLVYWLLPSVRSRNILLLAVSLLFYAYGEPVYVFLMIASSFFNYICALLIKRSADHKKVILAGSVAVNLGILCVFKYAAFLAESINSLTGLKLPVFEVALPVGISFFTFQAMSYVIDVYRGEVLPQRSFVHVLLYISLFPQLIAGPIVKYHDVESEIMERSLSVEETALGIRRFIAGMGKKVLIANYMGKIADTLFAAPMNHINIFGAWLGAGAYMLQIYFDFSGYSDMAIGMGRMFGFHFKENFNVPYTSVSIREFWRRWHISLSGWFREYLYIPLGGNRKGRGRTCVNKLIVFAATGMWHGADVTFLFWGLYHGCLLMMEEYIPFFHKYDKQKGGVNIEHQSSELKDSADIEHQSNRLNDHDIEQQNMKSRQKDGINMKNRIRNKYTGNIAGRVFGHVYVVLAVMIGFVFFRADDMRQGVCWVYKMFAGFQFGNEAMRLVMSLLTPIHIAAFAAGIIASGSVFQKSRLSESGIVQKAVWPLSMILLVICMMNLAGGTYNPFIYFRF